MNLQPVSIVGRGKRITACQGLVSKSSVVRFSCLKKSKIEEMKIKKNSQMQYPAWFPLTKVGQMSQGIMEDFNWNLHLNRDQVWQNWNNFQIYHKILERLSTNFILGTLINNRWFETTFRRIIAQIITNFSINSPTHDCCFWWHWVHRERSASEKCHLSFDWQSITCQFDNVNSNKVFSRFKC